MSAKGQRADVSDELSGTRQNNSDFCELTRLCIDFDSTSVLLDDDVVADGEPQSCPFSSWLGRKERLEHLFFHVGRDAGAVVADSDLHTIAEAFGRGRESWLVVSPINLRRAPGCRVEAV